MYPSAAVGALANEAGILYLLDSCQAAGQLELDVKSLGCDFLVFTGRKFVRGPRGTGVLYAKGSTLERLGPSPFVDGRSAVWTSAETYELMPDARRFEFGEQNFAGKVGLGVAIEYALELGIDPIAERITTLAGELRRPPGSPKWSPNCRTDSFGVGNDRVSVASDAKTCLIAGSGRI